MLRVVFFGLPLAALLLARDGHEVALCCVCRSDALGLRRARRRIGEGRVVVKPSATDPALGARVAALSPDLIVSWFWTTRLPAELLGCARLGALGVHPSLLPRHRGPDPTYWAIASGDLETGVSVHRLDEGYDTGDLLAQERLAIDPGWNAWQLARALDRPSLRLLREVVRRLAAGEPLAATPQDPALSTYAPFPDDEACAVRWSWTTERIVRHVRALAPAPGAFTDIAGKTVTLTRIAPAPVVPRALEPGEGAIVAGMATVRTGDGAVVLLEGEIDEVAATAADLAALFPQSGMVIG